MGVLSALEGASSKLHRGGWGNRETFLPCQELQSQISWQKQYSNMAKVFRAFSALKTCVDANALVLAGKSRMSGKSQLCVCS